VHAPAGLPRPAGVSRCSRAARRARSVSSCYLVLQTRNNRLGLRPYAAATFHHRLGNLTRTLAITDSVGRPAQISKNQLPPKQVCSKGHACLTCDKFVTDASHQDELRHQLDQAEALISRRQAQFASRYGQPMGEDIIWLSGRLAETNALSKVLVALDRVGVQEDGTLRAVRAAGTPDRAEPSTAQSEELKR
jgi:hypothetical protein